MEKLIVNGIEIVFNSSKEEAEKRLNKVLGDVLLNDFRRGGNYGKINKK